MDAIAHLDQQLFHYVNQVLAWPPLDPVMTTITRIRYWRVPIGILGLFLFFRGGKRGRIVVLLMIPAIAFSDIFNDQVFKHLFERVRPCRALLDVRKLVHCSHSSSFPSNHAFNIFTAATLFAQFYPWRVALAAFAIASAVGFSRVYVGVHYPLDVLAGAAMGIAWGSAVAWAYRRWEKRGRA